MSFGGGDKSQPMMISPGAAPNPPPNPPMFGEAQRKQRPKGQTGSMQFNASVLGSLPDPAQRAMKTLLGQ